MVGMLPPPPATPTPAIPAPRTGADGRFEGDPTAASIFITVLTRGPIPRNEIAQQLSLSPATVSKAVRPATWSSRGTATASWPGPGGRSSRYGW
jgi:hypothetical protein